MATYKHLRSSTANKRPTTSIADGQLAINTNTASPGLFFKDSAGTGIVKVGPVHVGTTAPNSSPAAGGSSGNYLGEQWLDTSLTPAQLKVWNGSQWIGVVADELPVSKLQDGAARQLLQTDAAGTGVEWTSNVDVPGTLDVTGATTLDSTLTVPLGSAASPTLRFSGDANTGVYSPGADQLALSTNGTGRLFVDASGRVGLNQSTFAANNPALHIRFSNAKIYLEDIDDVGNTSIDFAGASGIRSTIRGSSDASPFLATEVNGSERLRITSAGLVGIGTSAPSEILDAYGNIRFGSPNIGRIYSTDGQRGSIQISAPNDATNRSVSYGNNYYINSSGTWVQAQSIIGGSAIEMRANSNNYGEFIFRQKQDGDLGGAERIPFVINTNGNVGIGTTNPAYQLSLGTTAADVKLAIYQGASDAATYGFGIGAGQLLYQTPGAHAFRVANSEVVRIDSSGRLLLGTSTSTATGGEQGGFQVAHASGSSASFTRYFASAAAGPIINFGCSRGALGVQTAVANGDNLGRIRFSGSNGTDLSNTAAEITSEVDGEPFSSGDLTDLPGRIVLSTTPSGSASPVERMRIDSSGLTTLKTNVASSDICKMLGTTRGLTISTYTAGGTGAGIKFAAGDVTYGQIQMVAGTTGGVQLNVGATSWAAISDERLKVDLTPIDNGLNKVSTLRAVTGRYTYDAEETSRSFLIAQDVQAVLPEAVSAGDDDDQTLTLRYTETIPLLVAALKEAKQRIETLEQRLNDAGIN